MDVWVNSASASVQRTLEDIARACGHTLMAKEQAQLWVEDQQHPGPGETPHGCITVKHAATGAVHALSVPAKLPQLMRAMARARTATMLTLAGGWVLDVTERRASHADGQTLTLTEKECLLLSALHIAAPGAIPREALLAEVWGMQPGVDTHTLETHIYRLRQKLGAKTPTPGDILTENGAYRFVLDVGALPG